MKKITISNNFQIDLYTPKELKSYLDEYIIGQDSAKKILSVAAYNHYKRLYLNSSASLSSAISKSNLLISGPTGCGKTMLVKTIANRLGVPYYIADATSLTQAGYVGDDVESVLSGLLRMCNYDIDKAQCGIVFIDEIDKLAKRGSGTSLTRDVGGEGVQQALLKMVEGSVVGVPPQEGRKHPEQPLLYIDTSNILFIVSGAFSGIEEIIKKRVSPNQSLGYASSLSSSDSIDFDKEEVHDYLSHDDLRNYGFIPEFIGRFPILANVTQLTKDDLIKIITEPKDNILDQYATLLAFDDITLNITDKAIETIAESTLDLGTGARGLKSTMEAVMHDYMYDLPGSGVKEITITPKDVKAKLSKRFSNLKPSKKTNKMNPF